MGKIDLNQLQAALDKPNVQVAVLLPQNPNFDDVAAALALKLALDKAGRKTAVACVDPMTVEVHRLVAANTVTAEFGNRNLIIAFPGQTEAVDKISYNVEGGELQLVVTPKSGVILDHTKLKFVPSSAGADIVIMVGVRELADLGELYSKSKDVIDNAEQFWLDGQILSQEATKLIQHLRLPVDPDVASNLLAGIEQITNHYQSPVVSADTFEAAAFLMRQGAHRHDPALASQYPAGSIPTTQPQDQAQVQAQPEPDWYEPKIYRGTSVS